MQQLTGIDTGFLVMDNATSYGHVGALALFDPGEAGSVGFLEATKQKIRERLHLLPPYRWRLVEVPFGIDRPYWINDPDFDLDYHVRHIAVPAPGNREQLAELIARLHARHLDRRRPLWELYVIEGLEGGRVAQYTKMHHAAIDGVSGSNAMTTLMDLTPEGLQVPPPDEPWQSEPVPSEIEMYWRGVGNLATQPVRFMRWNQRLLRALPGMAELLPRRDRTGSALRATNEPAPRTPFNRVIGPQRRFAYGTAALQDVKQIKNAFGTTVNDVVMATCAAALRRWLLEHDALPETPLVASVPVSIRSEDEKDSFGNRVSAMIAPIATHLADPAEQLRFCHEAMKVAKEQFNAIPADVLTDATQFLSPALAALAARAAARTRIADYANPPFNLVISNVPGPRVPLYIAGRELLATYPVSAIADGSGLNMTVYSYRDSLDFGFVACRDLVPDLWSLAGYFEDAVRELKLAADKETS